MINPHIRHSLESGLWLAGLRAGVELAKTHAVPVCYTSGEYEDEIAWAFVDAALKKLENE